ncbi:hypothetical protein BCR34DRAFT_484351 [Clohesyomyces aquaticus]|uniref:Zn(2)-C6 fungal-type domain-containing protein n=1 Tax=Clohesyomyces aquaticus TaxID=1231657 RepID=A0A1Y1ZM50_9PLEO|nr:hypothetical protein BCR34DRAFT_484351 [Clohesyomyces aquaticus]
MDSPNYEGRTWGPDLKRRKVRKGTRSCWECKRRKVKCSFVSLTEETCLPCRRRGTTCISQEVPEELAQSNNKRDQSDRIDRMEAILKQLGVAVDSSDGVRNSDVLSRADSRALPTPSQSASTPTSALRSSDGLPAIPPHEEPASRGLEIRTELSVAWNDSYSVKLGKVSRALYAALPAPHDVQSLCDTYKDSVIISYLMITRSYQELESDRLETVSQLAEIPGPNVHPVLLAKWMLLFALFLQQSFSVGTTDSLSERPQTIIARLKDTATCLVATNEELFGTVESLECIMLDAAFEKNSGNFRRAWLAVRRAMTAAQLMNLHRPETVLFKRLDPTSKIDPRYLWNRIIYMDRFICLMLGLPSASLDIDVSIDYTNDTPTGRLERTHTKIAKRILERNEADPAVDDYTITEAIDAELLEAAESLPHQFWQPLDFSNIEKQDSHIFRETMRIAHQVYHFNLLSHLHLPYLLPLDDERYASSKITCAHASRELLTRWMSYRRLSYLSATCRIGDFFALRASLTLCLAHIGNHHCAKPLLALRHQRLGDCSMIEESLDIMEIVAAKMNDRLARESADLLRRLVHVEADAAQGQIYNARKCLQGESAHDDEDSVVSIYIPYFGVLKISPEGTISKDVSRTQPTGPVPPDNTRQTFDANESTNSVLPGLEFCQFPRGVPLTTTSEAPREHLIHLSAPYSLQPSQCIDSSQCVDSNEPYPSQDSFIPDPVAGIDDWAFQGVDTAFFDSLLRGMTGTTTYAPSHNQDEGGFGRHNQS